ncbi:LCP family protein [Caloramator sp. Dgby_cultured_2]|nr:LCP family protein [Caloramator sp. Dgby_cultured_2]WDU84536.1 LCP family protein [Caloramator sp. Dgby_cultured_2]
MKLISLMRDMFVEIPGKNKNRINAAYAFGGPELAIKTINHNFDLGISKYVTINFYGFEKVIDNIGGVEIDVKKMK